MRLLSGGQIHVPPSTQTETTWYILLDGMQFTYNTLRCTLEFDHDHSRSNSMRPPEIPRTANHFSVFTDIDLLPDAPNPDSNLSDVSNTLEASAEPSKPACFAKTSLQSASLDKENTVAEDHTGASHERERPPLVLDVKPPPLQTTVKTVPLKKRDPNHGSRCVDVPTAVADIRCSSTTRSQALETDCNDTERLGELQKRSDGESIGVQAINISRQPGEESQVLEINAVRDGVRAVRLPGEESQKLEKHAFKHTTRLFRQLGEESQVIPINGVECHNHTMKELGKESQPIAGEAVIGPKEPHREAHCPTQRMRVRNTAFVKEILKEESERRPTKGVSFETTTRSPGPARKISPLVKDAQPATIPEPKPSAVLRQNLKEKSSKRGSNQMSTESPHVLASTIPRKRSASDVFSSQPYPAMTQTRGASLSSETADDSTDVSTASETAANSLKPRKKRRRSPRNNTVSLRVPAHPTVMFSSNCEVPNKKRTIETFLQLGGKVTEKISEADILCVTNKDGLKKTSKLILAIIYGKIVVTESWLVQCTRDHKFVHPGSHQPRDKAKEAEWSVKFPAALNRGHFPDANLDQLFQGHNMYLTPQLQKQLSNTSNLDGFTEIAMAMGANSVRKRLPVKAGAKTIVLGIAGDFDALTVGKLGLSLYDKDLLAMSALRGRKEDDKDEFKIEISIKEEEMSQA